MALQRLGSTFCTISRYVFVYIPFALLMVISFYIPLQQTMHTCSIPVIVFTSTGGSRTDGMFTGPVYEVNGLYLERLVQQKKIEVDRMLRQHQSSDDPLVMRMYGNGCNVIHYLTCRYYWHHHNTQDRYK